MEFYKIEVNPILSIHRVEKTDKAKVTFADQGDPAAASKTRADNTQRSINDEAAKHSCYPPLTQKPVASLGTERISSQVREHSELLRSQVNNESIRTEHNSARLEADGTLEQKRDKPATTPSKDSKSKLLRPTKSGTKILTLLCPLESGI